MKHHSILSVETFTLEGTLFAPDLDARYARLYGLDERELRYILDHADVYGEDYPSESFRVLK